MLGDAEGEQHVGQFGIGRLAPGDHFERIQGDTAGIARLQQEPPAIALTISPGAAGSGRLPVASTRRFFLVASTASAAPEIDGATITSANSLEISSAVSASSS